ncbi:DivIVA domain-containing protein [Demequina globuliformis]|uniref:DivIVA domain-containing protein n=1 Tax=Demequina globuliformis TaxID=676202 RepID=UPI000A041094
MALLTAEDVLNKAFSKTKYREGFDQDEVDDFLDEVAQTVTALTAERDDLAQRLAQAQAGQAATPAAATAEPSESENLLQAATDPTPPTATGMLAMAQKLHDDYVSAGEAERDRLIDEAKVKAESIVGQAETDAKSRLDELASERTELEGKIDDLRRFERDYRSRLKGYLENLLGDLDHGSSGSADAPAQDATPERVPFASAFAAEGTADAVAADTSVVSAPSASDEATDAVEDSANEPAPEVQEQGETEEPAPSPWAQVRPASSPSAGGVDETTTPWGASQYTPRFQADNGEDAK